MMMWLVVDCEVVTDRQGAPTNRFQALSMNAVHIRNEKFK